MVKFLNSTIHQRFIRFHREHPEVYKHLVHLAVEAQLAGRQRIGMKALYEKLRWDYMVDPMYRHTEVKLPNNFTSRYSRMIMENVPSLRNMFSTADLRRL